MELLSQDLIEFTYPLEFIEITNRGLVDFEPWIILEGEYLQRRFEGLQKRYADRKLIPFARRLDNDDIACWEKGVDKKVVVIHDFASKGWEVKIEFDNFWMWFKQAIEDMIQFIEG